MGWVEVPVGPKRSQIRQIMRSIYSHRGHPVPADIDHWWHSPQIKYLVENPDDNEPKICIINLGEGDSDYPSMSTHFMINLDQQKVTDKYTQERFTAPQEVRTVLREVRDYAVDHFKSEKESKERLKREQEEREKARARKEREDVEAFHRKLVENEVITEEDIGDALNGYSSVNFCPVCVDVYEAQSRAPPALTKCSGCQLFLCLTEDCEAYNLYKAKSCSTHTYRTYCKSCFGSGDNIRLRPCPEEGCERWMCKEEWKWCLGEPLDVTEVVKNEEDGGKDAESGKQPPSKKRKKESQRRHERRLAPCPPCLQKMDMDWLKCDSRRCWSQGTICSDCSPDGQALCSNCPTWICDTCSRERFPLVWPCPSCNDMLCGKCNSIKRCDACGISQKCETCLQDEEDKRKEKEGQALEGTGKNDEGPGQPAEEQNSEFLSSACGNEMCDYMLCEPCLEKGLGDELEECGGCGESYCSDHMVDTCENCNKSLCDGCADGDRLEGCSCGGFGSHRLELAAMEDMYGAYDEYDDFY